MKVLEDLNNKTATQVWRHRKGAHIDTLPLRGRARRCAIQDHQILHYYAQNQQHLDRERAFEEADGGA